MVNFAGFLVCAIVIFISGRRLSWYADKIADKTGLGKAWIGLILLATVTSLPELMVGISASAVVQSADLAVGEILGSCAFNLAILAVMDIFVPLRQPLFHAASQRHILSASLGIVLIALAGVGLLLPETIVIIPGIGIMSFLFVLLYFFSIKLVYRYDHSIRADETSVLSRQDQSLPALQKLVYGFVIFALITVSAALFIPYFADKIVEQTGMKASFMGTVFVAVSTSLPEIAVSLAAVRIGAVDMAVGNLYGSNIFNILILAIDDIFYTKGVLLKDASDSNLLTVFFCIAMAAVSIAGLTYHAPKKRFLMAADAVFILLLYITGMVLLYLITS